MCTGTHPPQTTYNRHGDGSCISGVAFANGDEFPCLKGKALFMSDLSSRNYAAEMAGDPGPQFTHRGVLSVSSSGDIEAADNTRVRLQVTHDFGETAVFMRLFAGPHHQIYMAVVSSMFTGEGGLIARIAHSESNPLCDSDSSSSSDKSSSSSSSSSSS